MNIIKQKRIQKGMTKKQVADRLGLPVIIYSFYENHLRYITAEMVEQILSVFGVPYNL